MAAPEKKPPLKKGDKTKILTRRLFHMREKKCPRLEGVR